MNPPDPNQPSAGPGQTSQPIPAPAPPATTNPEGVKLPFNTMQPNEQVICEVRRHPFGMLTLYLSAGLLLILFAVGLFLGLPSILSTYTHNQANQLAFAIFLVIAVLTAAFVAIAHYVYWGNRWVLTSDSVSEVNQLTLFNRHTSQLSLGNLEDVTAEKNGILAHMFNFGTLRVETAGERARFILTYCPRPDYYAQCILNAREAFEENRRVANFGNQDLNRFSNRVDPPSGTNSGVPS